MKRAALPIRIALPLLVTLGACSLRAPRVESTPCSNTSQCDRPSVCFLGECRGHSAALTLVAAEVRPPTNSPLAAAQVAGIDLHKSVVHDFPLAQPFAATGTVTQAQDAAAAPSVVPNALVTFTDHAPVIADRVQQVSVRTDASGAFDAGLPPGAWDVLVNPAAPLLPPYRPAAPLQTAAPKLDLVLPRVNSLVTFQAALTADGGVLAGADVTAVDATGNALSAPATVQLDGGFLLYLPPNTILPPNPTAFFLQVGPPPADIDGGSAAAALSPLPSYDPLPPPTTPAVDVELTAVATLQGKVLDASGAPLAFARVYARSDNLRWSLSRSTVSLADGSYALPLRAGDYLVEAAPISSLDGPAVSGEQPVISLPPAGARLDLTCPTKVRAYGRVVRADGSAVSANYQVTATRAADHLLTARTVDTVPTNTSGLWFFTADPGRYRIEVIPPAGTGLPRKVVQIELAAPAGNLQVVLPEIAISPPLTVGGTVCAPASPAIANATACDPRINPPVANATVSFYALDADGHSVLLGSAPTDSQGRYQAVLPDAVQPGAAAAVP